MVTSNLDKATEVMMGEYLEAEDHPDVATLNEAFERVAQALADDGLLAPDPIALDEGDRNYVIDYLTANARRAGPLGMHGMANAWWAAANAFVAYTYEEATDE